MRVKLILPALTEAKSPFFRPVKYSLFPPLGLATLAGYLDEADDITLVDEHVEKVRLDDEPELVAIEVYITSARRAYEIADHYRAKGAHVCLGGLHVTSLPEEAAQHADTIFLGPGEDTWPKFLRDFREGKAGRVYKSTERTLVGQPKPRRDLIKRHLYLAPNSLVVSRGCPHACDFCYKTAFFEGGPGFYTQRVEDALEQVAELPGRHLYFLDDNLFGDIRFARELMAGMEGMRRVWQAAATVPAVFKPGLMERAARAGLRSLFLGFESLSEAALRQQNKLQNVHQDYAKAVKRLRDLGVMVNASFVFGMDGEDESVFARTVEWGVAQGIETATFHILTPYPGTPLHGRMVEEGRITSWDWDRYDTRHAVYEPIGMSAERLEQGYRQAYEDFYRWGAIWSGAMVKETWAGRMRHLAIAGAWKKCEPVWDVIIRAKQVSAMGPVMERVLAGGRARGRSTRQPAVSVVEH